MIDAQGRVIGVNSQIETANGGGGNVGIGFAVPSNTVKSVVAQLLVDGRVDRAFLGVTLQDVRPNVAGVLRLPADKGVLVGAVKPGSPAAKAGLKGGTTQVVVAGESYQLGGDMIVALNGKPVASVDALRDAIAAHKPGRDGEPHGRPRERHEGDGRTSSSGRAPADARARSPRVSAGRLPSRPPAEAEAGCLPASAGRSPASAGERL